MDELENIHMEESETRGKTIRDDNQKENIQLLEQNTRNSIHNPRINQHRTNLMLEKGMSNYMKVLHTASDRDMNMLDMDNGGMEQVAHSYNFPSIAIQTRTANQ
ncbi:hypothetical protein MKX01_010899, partial [Papaver californicum]